MDKPLVDNHYTLEKYPGKGGWTFALIPEIPQDKKSHFGWVKVSGTIDGYEIKRINLMPSGKGQLFLSVKAEIRKAIRKQAGDSVHIILYPDLEPLDIAKEWLECLAEESKAYDFFKSLKESEQKFYLDRIYSAKTDETKVNRMGECMDKLIELSNVKNYRTTDPPEEENNRTIV
jgi:Domain of unknown function (DUF1905)/Bacteriocin-protection, YdeI or OmpD-Associated